MAHLLKFPTIPVDKKDVLGVVVLLEYVRLP